MSNQVIIEFDRAHFSWDITNLDATALKIDNLVVNQSQHAFIQGESGSGKTTLLNLISGIHTLNKGVLKVLGKDLASMSASQRDQFRVDHMGVIFQQFNLLPYLSALDNVLLPLQFSTLRKNKVDHPKIEAANLLNELGIAESHHLKLVSEFSVGQQQRISVARALIGNPEIIVADEPTSALDANNRDNFIELLFRQADAHCSTVIFVSHDNSLSKRFSHHYSLPSRTMS